MEYMEARHSAIFSRWISAGEYPHSRLNSRWCFHQHHVTHVVSTLRLAQNWGPRHVCSSQSRFTCKKTVAVKMTILHIHLKLYVQIWYVEMGRNPATLTPKYGNIGFDRCPCITVISVMYNYVTNQGFQGDNKSQVSQPPSFFVQEAGRFSLHWSTSVAWRCWVPKSPPRSTVLNEFRWNSPLNSKHVRENSNCRVATLLNQVKSSFGAC